MAIDRNNNENNQILIEKLRAIIYIESHKPVSERDMDLIDECVDYLMELEDDKDLTVEQISTAKENFMQLVEDKYPTENKTKAKKLRFKPFLVAACFVVLMVIANFVALACGVDTMSILKEWGNRIVEMFEGEKTDYQNITIIKEKEAITFSSVDEFLDSTELNVMYPAVLPDDIEVSIIAITGSYDSKLNYNADYFRILFSTTDPNIFININCNPDFSKNFLLNVNMPSTTINNYECYIVEKDETNQCTFVHKDITYVVQAPTYEALKTIISNFKEEKQ